MVVFDWFDFTLLCLFVLVWFALDLVCVLVWFAFDLILFVSCIVLCFRICWI